MSLSLISMIVLLIAMAGLLFYIAVHLPKGNAVSTDIGALATLPNPQPQQQTTPSEPVSTPIRLIFIVSVLIVFVSAALMLFRLISKHFFKEE
ncbi:MAG TPA: hypothetical protein PLJ78_13415 [Anaerolineae bacterium]|nr:hypothetical protein [Anaerolineae bacterium]